MGTNEPWLANLAMLACRFEGYGLTADLASMDLMALWGLYCFLKRLASE
jgi:hypothetical protein